METYNVMQFLLVLRCLPLTEYVWLLLFSFLGYFCSNFICIPTRQNMCRFYFTTVIALMVFIWNSFKSFCPQWSLTTAWGMRPWFSRAPTRSSTSGQMDPSLPRDREPAWMRQFSLKWQRVALTQMSGRLWFNWPWLTCRHQGKMKMRWVTHRNITLQVSIIISKVPFSITFPPVAWWY